MFQTQIKTEQGRIASITYGDKETEAHRADELLASSAVMSAAVVSVTESGAAIRETGWHNGSQAFTRLIQSIVQFPYTEGQRVLLAATARTAPSHYGEITSILLDRVFVRIDGELAATPVKQSEIAQGFEDTSAATHEVAWKAARAVRLYYSRWGSIRLEYDDGNIERWTIPDDDGRDKTTVEYAVWRMLDTHYRSEWMPIDQHEEYGQVCVPRP